MMYSIQKFKNNYGIETPVVAVLTNVSSYVSFPFTEQVTSATVSVYVDGVEFRDKIKKGINGEISVMDFNIQPIDTKFTNVDNSAVVLLPEESEDKRIISMALNINSDQLIPIEV